MPDNNGNDSFFGNNFGNDNCGCGCGNNNNTILFFLIIFLLLFTDFGARG